MKRILCVVTLTILCIPSLHTDTYQIDPKYKVVALDAENGEMIWSTKPEQLAAPRLSVHGDILLAREKRASREDKPPLSYKIDVDNGNLLDSDAKMENFSGITTQGPSANPGRRSKTGGYLCPNWQGPREK